MYAHRNRMTGYKNQRSLGGVPDSGVNLGDKRKLRNGGMETVSSKELKMLRDFYSARQAKGTKPGYVVKMVSADSEQGITGSCDCGKDPCECFVEQLVFDEEM